MDKKTTGLIATIASVLLCGCPGIFLCLFGALTATGNGTFNEQYLQPSYGYVLLCLSLIFIIIPVAVGFFTLRKKPQPPVNNEPIPPTA
jgi:integral membrane sensor domain MASE1